jgi:hypothetical protein
MTTIKFNIEDQECAWQTVGWYTKKGNLSKRFFQIADIDGVYSKTSLIKYLKSEGAKNIEIH